MACEAVPSYRRAVYCTSSLHIPTCFHTQNFPKQYPKDGTHHFETPPPQETCASNVCFAGRCFLLVSSKSLSACDWQCVGAPHRDSWSMECSSRAKQLRVSVVGVGTLLSLKGRPGQTAFSAGRAECFSGGARATLCRRLATPKSCRKRNTLELWQVLYTWAARELMILCCHTRLSIFKLGC